MTYRTPAQVRDEFRAHPRRALIITTVVHESRAVKAHLTDPQIVVGEKGGLYEYGRFSDPAGEWLVVHAITPQGNADAGLVASKAHQEFGSFQAQIFVGVAGSLKEDIPIGSVVAGDYVYNGHSAKVEDSETLARPHGLPSARELLTAAQALIYSDDWQSLIRAPAGLELPNQANYPCEFPPSAVIKGIVSGEEVVAGGKSSRYTWLRSHFNDCGAVEMEGWGVMNAAHHENTSAIVVRGISDMCAGKDHAKDKLHQPIAAAHAAAFAFSILSFRSKVPEPDGPVVDGKAKPPQDEVKEFVEPRIDFVFSFSGSKDEWSKEKVESVVERLKRAINDENLTVIRIEAGSVRLVASLRERDAAAMDISKLREALKDSSVTLLGAAPLRMIREADKAREALTAASTDLLAWERTLPGGFWMERPEQRAVEARFQLEASSTVLLGEPGSGKSALLSKIASDKVNQHASVFALKSDFLSTDVRTEADLQRELQLPAPPSELILRSAALQPVYVFIDQLDALASQLDLRSGRLNVLLNLVRRIGGLPNVHVILSARRFEFNHDVRLRVVNAEAITLALPPWHEVKNRLAEVGVDSDPWPEKARDVIRSPQALKTFIALVAVGRAEPFTTYQAMLEQLWLHRIASADDSESLIALASDLAGDMAEEEALWLAAARFDDRLTALRRLEALGFVVRSDNDLSVAFSHQTVFEYVLARTFVRNSGLLSNYVLERQDSLFVRAKVWSALNYLREAEVKSYEREFVEIWKWKGLRRHIRLLLIEFLGQVKQPFEFEKACLAEVMSSAKDRILGLKAIADSPAWLSYFGPTAIRDAMQGSDAEAGQVLRILSANWRTNSAQITALISEQWLPHIARDGYSWMAVQECPIWTDEIERLAGIVLARTPISIWQVSHAAQTIATEQPDVAMRLVRAKLDFLFAEAKAKPELPPYPDQGTQDEQARWYIQNRRRKEFDGLLDATEWHELPTLAETAPEAFLQYIWPWYVAVSEEILAASEYKESTYVYPGRYVAEIELTRAETRASRREKPLADALQVAVEELAGSDSGEFLRWAEANSRIEILSAQQLVAYGYEIAADKLASKALEWLIQDARRFQLGTSYGHRSNTINLICACAPHWTKEEVGLFEKAARNYRPALPEYLTTPEQRKLFADEIRATRKDLLQAVGLDRLTIESRELAATEQRALGDRFSRSIGESEGGWIGSPMEAAAMGRAKDRDILNIFREVPDKTNWDHPTHWMRGGNIQLSRAFAEFARKDPPRAIRLMEQFEPLQQERAAGYALDAMADDAPNDNLVLEALLDLHNRGFQANEFRESAARAVEKIAGRKLDISDEVIRVLVDWLRVGPGSSADAGKAVDLAPVTKEEDIKRESILWGHGHMSAVPAGNFGILSALAAILLNRREPGRDRYLAILEGHLLHEPDPNIWKALLYRLGNAGGSTPQVVSAFVRKLFDRFPDILLTQEAVLFLAFAQRWDDQLVFDLISDWRKSTNIFAQRAYGELVGLVSTVKGGDNWTEARDEILATGAPGMKIGLAQAAVHMWPDEKFRIKAGETLTALLSGASREVVAVVMDVFRVSEELLPDAATVELLRALADPSTDLSGAPSHFVVERLQALLPYEAELVAAIAEKLIGAWRAELGDLRTGTAVAAPQLTDLALTLHRLGGASRQSGVALFEAMIEIDAYGARATLAEIDGRFGSQQAAVRQLSQRQGRRARRKKTT